MTLGEIRASRGDGATLEVLPTGPSGPSGPPGASGPVKSVKPVKPVRPEGPVRASRRHGPGYSTGLTTTGYWARALPVDRLARLSQDMHRAIVAHAGSPDSGDALLETVIGQAVETFVARAGHPVAAALQMSALMRQIGAREAAIGRSFDVLDTSLRIARGAAEAYFPRLLAAHPLSADRAQDLRDDLGIFIDQLREHARVGFDRQWSMEEMGAEEAELSLRRMLFDPSAVLEPERLRLLAHRAGRELPEQLSPLVASGGPLPRELLLEEDVLAGMRPHEAFVAGVLSAERAARLVSTTGLGVLVVGTSAGLVESPHALTVARRAAAMVAAGRIAASGSVLRCEEVLGQIATAADPYLLDVLAATHLGPLESMSPQRRVDMGELLLEWLETGAPVNEIARRRGQHTQTLHSRMRALRQLLGQSRLTDADQRVELILALRRALPRWRHLLATSR